MRRNRPFERLSARNQSRASSQGPSAVRKLWLLLIIVALAWIAPQTGPAQVRWQATEQQTPLIILNHGRGNFFILASEIPFRVRKAETRVSWIDVESLEDVETPPRTIAVTGKPDGLSEGTYRTAVRIDLSTSELDDFILIPVVLRVGRQFESRFGREPQLEDGTPTGHLRLEPGDPNIDVKVTFTPGGHLILEVLDNARGQLEQESLAGSLDRPDAREAMHASMPATYPMVFPWLCLEDSCSRKTESDINDVAPHVDGVSMISYERYSMARGTWSTVAVVDPRPWAESVGLSTWPMLVGGYQPTASDVQAMWDNRVHIAGKMVSEALEYGYRGYCVDVEGHADATTKDTFIDLLNHLADELHRNGFELMVAHASWSTIAPMADLAASSVDYVATMDSYTSWWPTYIPVDYGAVEPERLIWGITWDAVSSGTQNQVREWMVANGYNAGVAGSAAGRTALLPAHPGNDTDDYLGLRDDYPVDLTLTIVSLTNGQPKGTFGAGAQTDEVTQPETWRWSERFYGHQGIDGIASFNDACGARHTYAVGAHGGDLAEYLMEFGGDYDRLVLRGIADRPGPVNLAIYIDGQYRASASWNANNDCNQDVAVNISGVTYGTHAIAVQFTNDYYDPTTKADRNLYLDGLRVEKSVPPAIPSLTNGQPKGTFGAGAQTDEVTQPETWRWSERFYGHRGIDGIASFNDACGAAHVYAIGAHGGDLAEYLMKFGGDYDRLVLRGIADRPGPVNLAIYIDGQYQASASWNANNDCNQDVAVKISGVTYGTHAIAVQFTNDYYDPTTRADRNLYLDGLEVTKSSTPPPPPPSPSPYALLAPVSAGQELTVVHGYNDPLPGETCIIGRGPDHCANQKYGLDLRPSDPNDVNILAPLPGTVGWISGDCMGLTTEDNLNLNICHFGSFSVKVGQQVSRGTVLGRRSTYWIHLSLDDRYRYASKPPVPFSGVHTFEGISLSPLADSQRNQYNGRSFTSTNGATQPPPPPPQTSNLVDDGDSGFILYGPSQYWHRESIGYGGDMYWTYVNGSVVSNKVRWRPQLSGSGNYRVQVFVPRNHATTRSARYRVVANGGSYTATVNQSIYYDQWVTLGTYYFNGSNNGSEYVELTDATGEAGSTYLKIGFDAVRWVKQ